MTPSASVIVSTRNRAELLVGALASLLADRPARDWELVVVDNGSTDATRSVVERFRAEAAGRVPVLYVAQPRLGLSNSRNAGIAQATGHLLLFTDDDVLVEPGWVDALCAGFEDDGVTAVAGRVLPEWPHPPPRWLAHPHAGVLALTDFGDKTRPLNEDEYPLGANMALRAGRLGPTPFDPRLGHAGDTFFAYEEFELFRDLRGRGRFVYRPDAVVRHRVRPERMTWRGMRRATLHNGFGSRRAERLRGVPRVPFRKGVPYLVRIGWATLREVRRNRGRPDVAPAAAAEELRCWWALGRWLAEVFGEPTGARIVRRIV